MPVREPSRVSTSTRREMEVTVSLSMLHSTRERRGGQGVPYNRRMPNNRPASTLRSFPPVFWLANVMELFERAAYYGLNSVLAVYLTNKISEGGLGFTEQSVGFLQSLIYAFTYVIPIAGGALAERYGYRRMLLFSFSILTAGYSTA